MINKIRLWYGVLGLTIALKILPECELKYLIVEAILLNKNSIKQDYKKRMGTL